jgi:hypothetical protein
MIDYPGIEKSSILDTLVVDSGRADFVLNLIRFIVIKKVKIYMVSFRQWKRQKEILIEQFQTKNRDWMLVSIFLRKKPYVC